MPAAKKPTSKEAASPKLVKLVRDAEAYSAPHECECHPDEVENYAPGGWVKA